MNITLLSVLIFVGVFAAVVLIHEFGHFVAARLLKVEVEEFGIGLPPRALKLFHWKGTDFTLNWIPLGGFVRPKGENDPNVEGGLAAASPWARLGVLFAGPIMNLLAGVVVNSILFAQMGVPDMSRVMLYDVTPNSPAARAGLQADDFILAVDGEPINSDDEFRSMIQTHIDQPMQITVQRGDETLELTATPLSSRTADEGALGILPGPPMVQAESFIQAIPYGSMYTYAQIRQIVALPVMLIRNQLSPEEGRFIGLKGIYDLFGQAVSRDVQSRESIPPTTTAAAPLEPTNFTLQIIASLTLTLGIFNLLPFPALDGGRIIFVLPELIFRRRVPAEFENVVHAVGFALLLAFMLYVNAMDFINPVQINLP
jgi:regulator of sigma E protease